MTLKAKASLAIAVVLMLSGVSVFLIFNRVILQQFQDLEGIQARRNSGRIAEALQSEARGTEALARDWSMWDDAYSFVKEGEVSFVEENLSLSSLSSIDIDHLIFFDHEMEMVFSASMDSQRESLNPLASGVLEALRAADIPHRVRLNTADSGKVNSGDGVAGFIRLNDRDYIVGAYPVTNSEGTAPAAGVLCILREISPAMVERLSAQTKLKLEIDRRASLHGGSVPSEFTPFTKAFSEPSFSASPDTLYSMMTVKNILGSPLFSIKLSLPREVYGKGQAVERFLMVAFLGLTSITALLVIWIMQRLIVSPVAALGARLQEISTSENFAARVEVARRDELGTLSTHINETLDALQNAIRRSEFAQRQAEIANAAKSSFIAKVSHELRTPIHSITGMLRILLREERSGAKRNYIMMARNAAYGLLETINEILDFSKAEAGKLIIERVEFSIHETIREALQTIGPRVEEKGSLETIVEIQQGIPSRVYGDPLRLRQVMVNLLGNAAKFTKEGHIGIRASLLESLERRVLLQIEVFDSGVGIPANRLDHIFEPFGQADESVSRMFTGTGLGLTIVRQFVEAMGGAVSVESTLGVGSRFIITIPLETTVDAIPLVSKPLLASPRVALLDGNSTVFKGFARELTENGYLPEVFNCEDLEGLAKLSGSVEHYGLIVVTSEAMKRSRIFDFVVALRGNMSIPVVAILSPFEISARERLVALNVPFVVTRPIALFDILAVVDGQLTLTNEGWEDSEDLSLQSSVSLEVLVADDAQTNRIILTELLRDAGHNVVCVENGLDMVARIKESLAGGPETRKFDIILTDVQMPLLDGLNATAQIRALENELGAHTHLPIVAVTAHAMTDEKSRMRDFGVDDVVTKPLDPLHLGQVIQRLTGKQAIDDPSATRPNSAQRQEQPMTDTQLVELGLRVWRSFAKRDASLSDVFALSDDPLSPEDFQRVLDVVDVIDRSGDSVRRTLLIFQGFLDCFGEQIRKLNEAKRARSADDLRFAAHALKGLLLDVGARTAGELAGSIEQLSREGDLEEASAHVGRLTKQVLVVSRLISQISQSAHGSAQRGSTNEATGTAEGKTFMEQD
jgi:signal transduction histidine kinase/CheY-like chemotaxis protein/HPt (histidine-containing phosphotransfer) domain-containing protein